MKFGDRRVDIGIACVVAYISRHSRRVSAGDIGSELEWLSRRKSCGPNGKENNGTGSRAAS